MRLGLYLENGVEDPTDLIKTTYKYNDYGLINNKAYSGKARNLGTQGTC